jgi:hypothetical protein
MQYAWSQMYNTTYMYENNLSKIHVALVLVFVVVVAIIVAVVAVV